MKDYDKLRLIARDNSRAMIEEIEKANLDLEPFVAMSVCHNIATSAALVTLMQMENMSDRQEEEFLVMFFKTVRENIKDMKKAFEKEKVVAVEV